MKAQSMNRRKFLATSGAAAVGAMRLPALAATTTPGPEPFAFASAPVLTNPFSDEANVTIALNSPATGWVEYGMTKSLAQRATGNIAGLLPFGERILSIPITNLRAGQI